VNEDELRAGLAATPGYRYAKRVGPQLFLAGQVPQDGSGRIVGVNDTAAQATACLDNLRRLIELHRFEIDHISRLVVYVVGNQRNLADAWSAVRRWFNDDVPPATLLGVNLLGHENQLVEVDATVIEA